MALRFLRQGPIAQGVKDEAAVMDYSGETPMTLSELNQCVDQAVARYENVHPLMLKTLISVEGGQLGTVRRNTDKSYDVGPMQINTIHSKEIQKTFGYSMRDIAIDGCKNILVGAWLLSGHLKENSNKLWLSMGNYHSKTPSRRRIYLKKIAKAYLNLVDGIRAGNEAQAIGRTVNWGKTATKHFVPSLAELEQLLGEPVSGVEVRPAASSSPTPLKKPQPKVMSISNQDTKLRFID